MGFRTICPECGVIIQPVLNSGSGAYPPTGGDYEWVEKDTLALCTECGYEFEVCVRMSIPENILIGLVSAPLPHKHDISYFAAADITRYGKDDFYYINILDFFVDRNSAEAYLSNNPLNQLSAGTQRKIILINHQGHFDLNNTLIPSAFESILRFSLPI